MSETNKKAIVTEEHRAEARALKALWDKANPASQTEFGREFDIGSQAAVSGFLTGKSALSLKAATGFASGLACRIEEFSPRLAASAAHIAEVAAISADDVDAPRPSVTRPVGVAAPDGYIRLEHLSPQPSMGNGAAADGWEPVDVLEQWVRQKVGSANPKRIQVLTAKGHSMSPTIKDQDLVFIDVWQKDIREPGIYVIDVAGRLLLKKALILSTGTLILRSDNVDEYPDEERHDLNKVADTINVSGRVLAWWTLRQG